MDQPFDRTNIGLRERPSSGDFNQLQGQLYRTITHMARLMLSPRSSNTSSASSPRTGFMADGLRVVPTSPAAMTVNVTPGLGFYNDPLDMPSQLGAPDLVNVNDLSQQHPLPLQNVLSFAVPAAPGAPNSRIDIIEVRTDRRLEDPSTRRQLDESTRSFLDHVFFKTLVYSLDGRSGIVIDPNPSTAGISYKVGTAANPGVAPATTAGYVKIADINIGNATTSITGNGIADRRPILAPHGMIHGAIRWRQQYNAGSPTATIQSIIAPPGVDVGVKPDPAGKSTGFLYISAGEITQVMLNAQAVATNSLTSLTYKTGFTGIGSLIASMTSGDQAGPNAATPPLFIGVGQKTVVATYDAFYQDSTLPAGAQLDDITWHVEFRLGYH
jgi:hypothetical protein